MDLYFLPSRELKVQIRYIAMAVESAVARRYLILQRFRTRRSRTGTGKLAVTSDKFLRDTSGSDHHHAIWSSPRLTFLR